MHPTRWGDPAAATALPEAARGLVELAFGLDDRPAVEDPTLPAPTLDPAVVDELPRGARRRPRARRRRDPAAAHPWQVDARPAPRPLRRPGGRPRRRRPPRLRRRRRDGARDRGATPRRGGPVRRRHRRHRRTGARARRLRRSDQPRPRADEPAPRRRPRLDDRDARARTARSRGGGAAGRARADPRPLPAVLRARVDRRLRGHPLVRPGLGRLRPLRRHGRGAHRGDPDRPALPRRRARLGRRPRPAAAPPRLRGRLRRHHRR